MFELSMIATMFSDAQVKSICAMITFVALFALIGFIFYLMAKY